MRSRDPAKDAFLEAFSYNIITGKLTRKDGTIFKDSICHGYLYVWFCDRLTYQHRIAWLIVTGEWPENDIDHVNRIRSNNAWHNLRPVTRQENSFNRTVHKNNLLGVKGIRLNGGMYEPRIMKNGKSYYLGIYKELQEAIAVRQSAEGELHAL